MIKFIQKLFHSRLATGNISDQISMRSCILRLVAVLVVFLRNKTVHKHLDLKNVLGERTMVIHSMVDQIIHIFISEHWRSLEL